MENYQRTKPTTVAQQYYAQGRTKKKYYYKVAMACYRQWGSPSLSRDVAGGRDQSSHTKFGETSNDVGRAPGDASLILNELARHG